MLVTFTYFSCSWHWANKHIPSAKPSVCSVQSLGSLMEWNGTESHFEHVGDRHLELTELENGSVVGTEMTAFTGGMEREHKKIHETQLLHVPEYVSALMGPFFRLHIHNLCFRISFPEFAFDSLLETDPVSQGHCHLLKVLKVFRITQCFRSSPECSPQSRLLPGEANHQMESVCLELSPRIYPF